MVRKTVPQRNNIHKKRIAAVVCGGKWLLEGAGVEVAKVGGQVGGEGGVRNQRFTGEDAPGHAEFLVFPSSPLQDWETAYNLLQTSAFLLVTHLQVGRNIP